jgi:hypothetical protein
MPTAPWHAFLMDDLPPEMRQRAGAWWIPARPGLLQAASQSAEPARFAPHDRRPRLNTELPPTRSRHQTIRPDATVAGNGCIGLLGQKISNKESK